jgi:hypothetical protein
MVACGDRPWRWQQFGAGRSHPRRPGLFGSRPPRVSLTQRQPVLRMRVRQGQVSLCGVTRLDPAYSGQHDDLSRVETL